MSVPIGTVISTFRGFIYNMGGWIPYILPFLPLFFIGKLVLVFSNGYIKYIETLEQRIRVLVTKLLTFSDKEANKMLPKYAKTGIHHREYMFQ